MSEIADRNEPDILERARDNDDFRRVLITGDNLQIVAMTIPPGGEIGAESQQGGPRHRTARRHQFPNRHHAGARRLRPPSREASRS